MAKFQWDTVNTKRLLWATSFRSLCKFPLCPAFKLTLGTWVAAILLPASYLKTCRWQLPLGYRGSWGNLNLACVIGGCYLLLLRAVELG